MSRWVFRITAGFISILEIVAGIDLTMMNKGWWDKFCSLSIVAMGVSLASMRSGGKQVFVKHVAKLREKKGAGYFLR